MNQFIIFTDRGAYIIVIYLYYLYSSAHARFSVFNIQLRISQRVVADNHGVNMLLVTAKQG